MMGMDLLFGPSVERGPKRRRIYLTFDDGPNERATDAILETLAIERVPAAFFMVGDHVRRFPELARRVARAGHTVGNHTYNHVKLHFAGPKTIRTQLKKTHDTIESTLGVAPRAFRAPHGYRSPFLISIIVDMSYTVFGWTCARDYGLELSSCYMTEMATILKAIECKPPRPCLASSRMRGARATNSHHFPNCYTIAPNRALGTLRFACRAHERS